MAAEGSHRWDVGVAAPTSWCSAPKLPNLFESKSVCSRARRNAMSPSQPANQSCPESLAELASWCGERTGFAAVPGAARPSSGPIHALERGGLAHHGGEHLQRAGQVGVDANLPSGTIGVRALAATIDTAHFVECKAPHARIGRVGLMRNGQQAAIVEHAITSEMLPSPAWACCFPDSSNRSGDDSILALAFGLRPRALGLWPSYNLVFPRPQRALRLVKRAD